jgi:hypothetical protein
MSSPTPGSDPNYPQGAAPQGQPGWGAPQQPAPGYNPAPSYSAGPPASAGQRPVQVSAAAIIGIVIGALGLLGLFAIGLYFAFSAVLGLLSLLSVVAAVVTLVGGIQAIQGKSPRLLMLGAYGSIAVQLLTFLWALIDGYGFLFFGFLGLILPGVIVFLLMQPQSKQYFASRGISY